MTTKKKKNKNSYDEFSTLLAEYYDKQRELYINELLYQGIIRFGDTRVKISAKKYCHKPVTKNVFFSLVVINLGLRSGQLRVVSRNAL